MPTYEYHCSMNDVYMEVLHGMDEHIRNWGELCAAAGRAPGETPLEAPVKKLISAPGLAFPKGNAELKNLGFTKLVKREKGVYENVTAGDTEKRYMNADDPSSLPDLKRKIRD